MSKRIKHLSLKAGLLSSLLIACQLAAYAHEDAGQSIVVSCPDNPDHLVKLRPFVPNRQLPSRAQMAALQEERAQMAEQAQSQAVLNGKVSAFANSGYDPCARTTNASHRVNRLRRSNQAPVLHASVVNTSAAQFCIPYIEQAQSTNLPAIEPVNTVKDTNQNFSFLRMAEQHLSSLFNHPPDMSAGSQTQPAATTQFSETFSSNQLPPLPPVQLNEQMPNQPLSLSVSPVAFTPSMSQTSGYGSAGPPPFPLNLLPAPALKQLIRSMAYGSTSHASNSPPSYFGSWHNNFSPGVNSSINSYSNRLPQGNFHSYLQLAYMHRNIRYSSAPWVVTTAAVRRSAAARKQSVRKNSLQAKLVSYPAYATQSVPVSHLAQ